MKKELSESDIFKLNVVEGEEDLMNVDLKENASLKTDQIPEMSIPKSKSSTMSFIEKIFSSTLTNTASTLTASKETVTENVKILEETTAKLPLPVSLAAAASASSPNPECSPYKFLITETNNQPKKIESLKLESSGSKTECEIIENLASLNRNESEKHDPIVSGAAKTQKETKSPGSKSAKKDLLTQNNSATNKSVKSSLKSPSRSVSGLSGLKESNSSKVVDNLPASSHEFTMNLNFNLASAAAATAGGPVVVVGNSLSKSPVAKEHNKFTSNASTSSIHNDLKLILEEGKENEKKSSKPVKKTKESKSEDKLNKSLSEKEGKKVNMVLLGFRLEK